MGFNATLTVKVKRTMGFKPSTTKYINESTDGNDILPVNTKSTELSTECVVSVRRGNVRITYNDIGGDTVEIAFSKEDPGLVTYLRKNLLGYRFFNVFEKGVRHTCINSGGDENFEIISVANKLDNRLMTEGTLKLDYCIEAHGVRVETTEVRMTLKRGC